MPAVRILTPDIPWPERTVSICVKAEEVHCVELYTV